MTAKRESIVNMMVAELSTNPSRPELFAKLAKKWQLSNRSFDRYYKDAKAKYSISQNLIQQEIHNRKLQSALETVNQGLLNRETVLSELYADFNDLKKMKAGVSIAVIDEHDKVIEIHKPTPFDEVRAKQTRLSIAEKIAALEGWGPAPELPQSTIIQNNVQGGNVTTLQRIVNFKTRQTTIKDQVITEDPEE